MRSEFIACIADIKPLVWSAVSTVLTKVLSYMCSYKFIKLFLYTSPAFFVVVFFFNQVKE